MSRVDRFRVALLWLVLLSASSTRAADREDAQGNAVPVPPSSQGVLGEWDLRAAVIRQDEAGNFFLDGQVTIRSPEARMQADRMEIRGRRFLEAEGNVLVVWSGNRISGTRMTYDLEEDRGVIEDAIGMVDPEFHFWADRVEKIGEDKVFLKHATVTTCTQPIPYWSFSVSSARIRIDHYARMRNLRLRTGRVPIFYLPYMVWPVKRDRAAGLLFPSFGSTRDRGQVISEAIFLPLGSSADLTLFGEYYTEAGWGGGGEFRVIPNRAGSAIVNGFYIDDKVFGAGRYRVTYRQTQDFLNGFRMVADVNQVSDFAYFTDFERELRLASTPTILARVEMTRNGSWTSVNVRELRREQLFSDDSSLVQQTLPEIEWRGRSRRLGKSPFYLTYESSVASIQQRGDDIDADYLRGDFFPTLSAPLSPVPWLDVNPSVAYRVTHYTQHRPVDPTDPTQRTIVDEGLTRTVAGAGIEIAGPKISRIFRKPEGEFSPSYKHVIEPTVRYSYREDFDQADVIRYDDVDVISPSNLLTYGIRTRLFARRPRARPEPVVGEGERIVLPDAAGADPVTDMSAAEAVEPGEPPAPLEPVEIASLELRQSRSFDDCDPSDTTNQRGCLSFADLDGDGAIESRSQSSAVELVGRLNPTRLFSFDLRSRYDILFDRFADASLSGNMRWERARLNFSLVHRGGLGFMAETDPGTGNIIFVPREDTTQLRLGSGVALLAGKLRLDLDGSYDANPGPSAKHLPDQRWRMEYYTQCCGFLAEYLSRNFGPSSERREFRFTVDLRGIGKLIDIHDGQDR